MSQRACIYCGSTTTVKTSEHVLNKAFGANLTLVDEVCDDCNKKHFSAYDKALVDYVRTLDPLRNHPAVGSHDLMFFNGRASLGYDSQDNYHFAVRHYTKDGTWQRVPLQQIVIRPDSKMVYITGESLEYDDAQPRMALMRSELARPETLEFTFPDWRTADHSRPGNAIIARSAKNIYAVIAESEERDREIEALIRRGSIEALFASLTGVATPRRVEDPEFSLRGHIRDLDIPIAKIGFNFACKTLGYQAVMRSEFHWARRYIRYGESPKYACASLFTREERSAKMAENPVAAGLCSTPGHKLLLTANPGRPLQVTIILYEQLFGNVELLRGNETGWMDETCHIAVFDYIKKTSAILSMPKDMKRIVRLIRG